MARTQTRSKPSHKGPQGKKSARARKKQPVPWYREHTWLPWIIGVIAVGMLLFALRSGGTDAPAPGGSAADPVVGSDLHSLVVSPDDPDTLYIGSHQGVSISTDGGKSWVVIESLTGADAMGWAFTDDAILVGGHPGLSVSTDGGKTFESRNEDLPSPDVHALGAGDNVIYAGIAGTGIYASTDGGVSWEARSEEFGGGFMGRIQVDPADDDHILAPDMGSGAVESIDGGRTWEPLGGVEGAMWVSWSTADTDHMIAATQGEAVLSTDGGANWEPLEVPEGASIVEFSPHDAAVLYAAALEAPEASVYVSEDGGDTWIRP